MPFVQIRGVGGYWSREQAQELIRKGTDAVVSVGGEGPREVRWVLVEDVEPGTWGVVGQPVTDATPRQMAVG